jgi:hypothetical protein
MRRRSDGTAKNIGDFGESVENRRTKGERRVGCSGYGRGS